VKGWSCACQTFHDVSWHGQAHAERILDAAQCEVRGYARAKRRRRVVVQYDIIRRRHSGCVYLPPILRKIQIRGREVVMCCDVANVDALHPRLPNLDPSRRARREERPPTSGMLGAVTSSHTAGCRMRRALQIKNRGSALRLASESRRGSVMLGFTQSLLFAGARSV
jgi:hypothetical protein